MGLLYMAAGINHFLHPETYRAIMPPWLPAHSFLVFFSGAMEVLLGLLLFVPATRRLAAWGIILLLIAVFPANVQMVLNYDREASSLWWVALLRLPIQVVLIAWAWQYTIKLTDGD